MQVCLLCCTACPVIKMSVSLASTGILARCSARYYHSFSSDHHHMQSTTVSYGAEAFGTSNPPDLLSELRVPCLHAQGSLPNFPMSSRGCVRNDVDLLHIIDHQAPAPSNLKKEQKTHFAPCMETPQHVSCKPLQASERNYQYTVSLAQMQA
ncbi:hypothetical protein PV05_02661 [Exophiala xenobiotica]|uniref:Uncharacterized protein n=1 Tax=Exophiala xenobiotica TaxID=348802 RepID=A0A0D2C058_9EURO|nr:uncharacterized protein PV05_02661 [Exophiala xenobiotica]KIW58111.1 hypothetical protein PV05_02661 [Exophiala xenobiotica]